MNFDGERWEKNEVINIGRVKGLVDLLCYIARRYARLEERGWGEKSSTRAVEKFNMRVRTISKVTYRISTFIICVSKRSSMYQQAVSGKDGKLR